MIKRRPHLFLWAVCIHELQQSAALEMHFYPSLPLDSSFLSIVVTIIVCQAHLGHAAPADPHLSSQTLTKKKPCVPMRRGRGGGLRDLYLDQSILDDTAHVQPPFCHIRVLLIQVRWKGQQMRSEIFCTENRKCIWSLFFFLLDLVCSVFCSAAPRSAFYWGNNQI